MTLTERVFDEMNQLVVSTLGLAESCIVTKATKWVRFDWRSLLKYFETTGTGLKPPYCVIRPSPTEELDWGMAIYAVHLPIEIFYVDDERNRVKTTVVGDQVILVSGGGQGQIEVASTAGMFIDQRLFFVGGNEYGLVISVDDATHVTVFVESELNVADGTEVSSDMTSDIEVKVEKLKTALLPNTSHSHFYCLNDPVTDVSDMNPVNESMEQNNYTLMAGSCFVKVTVGEVLG